MAAVTSKDIAIAAEAINRHRGLTPSARQVAIEILQGMNKASATTWRSVNGLAVRLALSPRTIGNSRSHQHHADYGSTDRKGRNP